jgi:DNA-binding protein Fis
MILAEMMDKGLSYDEFINEYFASHYQELWTIASKSCKNTNFDLCDLVSELYIYLIDNEEKILGLKKIKNKDRTLTRFCGTWCYKQIRYYKANSGDSNFKGKFQIISDKKSITKKEKQHKESENCQVTDMYKPHKEGSEDKLFDDVFPEVDLYRPILDYVIQHELNDQEKILYKLHITEGMNMKKIKEHIGGNSSDYILYEALHQMKEKIKTKCNERRRTN